MCRRLKQLGYLVHTPPERFGSRKAAEGVADEVWLPLVGRNGWPVINRDLKIFEREEELADYRAAKVHVFLLPTRATAAALLHLVECFARCSWPARADSASGLAADQAHWRQRPCFMLHRSWSR